MLIPLAIRGNYFITYSILVSQHIHWIIIRSYFIHCESRCSSSQKNSVCYPVVFTEVLELLTEVFSCRLSILSVGYFLNCPFHIVHHTALVNCWQRWFIAEIYKAFAVETIVIPLYENSSRSLAMFYLQGLIRLPFCSFNRCNLITRCCIANSAIFISTICMIKGCIFPLKT